MEERSLFRSHLDVLIIGPGRELQLALPLCDVPSAGLRFHKADHLDRAKHLLVTSGLQPDVIILVLEWPGQYTAKAVETLAIAAPLARIVFRLGSWCQGISTTRSLGDFVSRLQEPIADLRIQRESTQLALGNVACSLARPATAAPEERLAAEVASWETSSEESMVTGVVSPNPLFRQWICEALQKRGESSQATSCVQDLGGRAGRIVWDLAPWSDATPGQVLEFLGRFPKTPVVGVLDFPRQEHRRELRIAGVPMLLAKPLLLSDLFWALDQLCAQQRTQSRMTA